MANRLSFVVKRDKNADIERRFILSVRIDDKCVIAPRYPDLNSALFDVPVWATEYAKGSVEYDIKVRL